jgi:hypothetical protein
MLYVVNLTGAYVYPIAADNSVEAIDRVRRLGVTGEFVSITPLYSIVPDTADVLFDLVAQWWGNYADRADGNDQISDAEYDEVLGWENDTSCAIFDAQN